MTTTKRSGSLPDDAAATVASAPIATPIDDPGATRVDSPLSSLKTADAALLFAKTIVTEKATAMMVPAGRTVPPQNAAAAPTRQLVPDGGPPKIELIQHQLPEEGIDRRLALVLDPDSEESAAFRVLRHHLMDVGRPQCVIVTSPQSGDGKTRTAINLALALAECGRAKVLLVETHVRRPQLASAFKFVPPWCFAEQLAAHRHQPLLPWSLIEIPRLWLHVAAINPRIEKSQLLDGPAFAIAMERLRMGGYDHIVVDAPPVLGSADVNLMADAADGVLLVARAKRTTAREIKRTIDQLGGAKIAGTVLVE